MILMLSFVQALSLVLLWLAGDRILRLEKEIARLIREEKIARGLYEAQTEYAAGLEEQIDELSARLRFARASVAPGSSAEGHQAGGRREAS